MKQFLLLFSLILFFESGLFAQSMKWAYVEIPGTLADSLSKYEPDSVFAIGIVGNIDARDFKTLRDDLPNLKHIDLSNVNIASYTGTEGTAGESETFYSQNGIPQYAFCTPGLVGKKSLELVVLPKTLTSIGDYSFLYCSNLSGLTPIPAGVKRIGRSAFNGNYDLYGVSFEPASQLTEIGIYAFRQCYSLRSITIPKSVRLINFGAFFSCVGLTSVTIEGSSYINNQEPYSYLSEIGAYAFYYCTALASFTAPSLLDKIGDKAFEGCTSLKSFSHESWFSLDSIGNHCFRNCSKLTKAMIPYTVKYIGNYCFFNCSNLTAISIPAATDSIGVAAFVASSAFITVSPENPNYSGLDGVLYDKNKTNLYFCPPSATGDFTVPSTVTNIAVDAFYNCSGLTSVELPAGLTSLEDWVFENCTGLSTLSLPSSLTLIGSYAFYNCSGLNSISAHNPAPVDLSSKTDVFFGIDSANCILYVPSASINLYKASSQWNEFIHITGMNQQPIAHAGQGQTVDEGATVTLDGSLSSDPDGDSLTFSWTAPAGIVLSDATVAAPTFIAPNVSKDTTYSFALIVNDGELNSLSSEVFIHVKNITPVIKLVSKINSVAIPSTDLAYQLYKKSGANFEEKMMEPVYDGDTTRFSPDQGEWIILVSPASDLSAFTPTYVGDVITWSDAEIINMAEEGVISRTINCSVPESPNAGIGEISGYIYAKEGVKSITFIESPLEGGIPVSGALVHLFKKGGETPQASCITNVDGFYLFEEIEVSEYEIVVELPGFTQQESLPVTLSEQTPTTVLYIAVNTLTQLITNSITTGLLPAKIYPNPFDRSMTIELNASFDPSSIISIYDAWGSLVLQKKISSSRCSLDLPGLVSGPYLIKIVSGNKTQSKVLIKE